MGIKQKHAIRLRQAGKAVGALRQLVRSLAVGNALLGRRLVEGRSRSAARVADQDHLFDAGLAAQKVDSLLDIDGDGLEIHRGFVVVRPRVHSEYHEAALREFSRRDQAHEIGGAVDRKEGDRRSGAAVRVYRAPLVALGLN